MNLFCFLKSTKGAIKPLNALLISGAAGAVFAYTVNTAADKQIAAERSVRTLASIEGTAPQEGLHRQGDLLTSINVRDGRGQLATPEERAAMKGTSPLDRYEANQRALNNMDANLGRAASFTEGEDGLNTGNRDAVQSPDRYVVGNPNANAGDGVAGAVYTRSGAQAGGQGEGGANGAPRLANASMARASGSSFGGSSGAVSGGIAAQGTTRSAGGGEGPARLSGAMPGGSNIVSQRAEAGLGTNNNTASFGRDRNARMMRGRRSGSDANELKDIVKKSAAAAQNVNASANEGGRAFMASAVNSGGVSVSGAGEDPTTRSADFAPTDKKLNAIGNKLNKVQQEQDERAKMQNALVTQLLATIAGSIGMMVAGALILGRLDKTIKAWEFEASVATLPADKAACLAMANMFRIRRWLTAAAMMATVTAANAWLFLRAAKFIDRYGSMGGTGLAKLATVLAPVMVAGMVFTAIKPTGWKALGKNIWGKLKAAFEPVGMLTSQVTGSIMGLFK